MNGGTKKSIHFLRIILNEQRHDELARIPYNLDISLRRLLCCFANSQFDPGFLRASRSRGKIVASAAVLEERPSTVDGRRIAIGGTGALFLLFSFRPLAFLVSSTAVTSVETSTLKGRYGGQMRRDKGQGRI